jgi:hypothetical protein
LFHRDCIGRVCLGVAITNRLVCSSCRGCNLQGEEGAIIGMQLAVQHPGTVKRGLHRLALEC